jgi:hypothetical protein
LLKVPRFCVRRVDVGESTVDKLVLIAGAACR